MEKPLGQEGEKKPDQTAEAAAKGEDNGMGIVEMEEEDPLVAVCMVSKWKGERNEVLMATAEGKERMVISRGRSVAVGPWNPDRLFFSILETTLKKMLSFSRRLEGEATLKGIPFDQSFHELCAMGYQRDAHDDDRKPPSPPSSILQIFSVFLSLSSFISLRRKKGELLFATPPFPLIFAFLVTGQIKILCLPALPHLLGPQFSPSPLPNQREGGGERKPRKNGEGGRKWGSKLQPQKCPPLFSDCVRASINVILPI